MHENELEPKGQAAPEESSASWSSLLADLVRSFILLRDFFGYVLPGAFFLLIGAYFHPAFPANVLSRFPDAKDHLWLLVLLLVGFSYLLGHFIIATSYLNQDLPKVLYLLFRAPVAWLKRKLASKDEHSEAENAKEQERQKAQQLEEQREIDRSNFLRFHKQFPDIYVEYDRQSILNLLRRGLSASIFLGILLFHYLANHPLRIMVVAAVIMGLNSFAGNDHLKRLRDRTLKAAKLASDAHLKRNF
jgi:hypothetical protein